MLEKKIQQFNLHKYLLYASLIPKYLFDKEFRHQVAILKSAPIKYVLKVKQWNITGWFLKRYNLLTEGFIALRQIWLPDAQYAFVVRIADDPKSSILTFKQKMTNETKTN